MVLCSGPGGPCSLLRLCSPVLEEYFDGRFEGRMPNKLPRDRVSVRVVHAEKVFFAAVLFVTRYVPPVIFEQSSGLTS